MTDHDDLLLSCRYGDIEDVQQFLSTHSDTLDTIQDDNGNSLLHMAAANGHSDILALLLPRVSPHLLLHRNHAGSTALHWAALNRHLAVAQQLVQFPTGPGLDLIDAKNDAGRSPLGEAELAGWDEGARWFVEVMRLDAQGQVEESDEQHAGSLDAIEVEIQDADGQLAKMSIPSKPS